MFAYEKRVRVYVPDQTTDAEVAALIEALDGVDLQLVFSAKLDESFPARGATVEVE